MEPFLQAEPGQGQEPQENHACMLCPTTPEEVARVPPPPPLEGAPMCQFRCGHSAHTHCCMNFFYTYGLDIQTRCITCQEHLLLPQAREHYDRFERGRNIDERQIVELWNTNPTFKKDLKEYKRLLREANKAFKEYNPHLSLIKRRFKENILGSVEMIKLQRKQAIGEWRALPSKKAYLLSEARVKRHIAKIERTYNLSRWEFRNLYRTIPRFPRMTYRNTYRWRQREKYIFRIRI